MIARSTKTFTLIISALALLGAVGGTASASAETPVNWYTGAQFMSMTKLVGSASVTAKIGETPVIGTHVRFSWAINGMGIEATASGAECVNCTISNRKNAAGVTEAFGKGKLRFTGETVQGPNCTVTSEAGEPGVIESRWLNWRVEKIGEESYFRFIPEAGEGVPSFVFHLSGPGYCGGPYSFVGPLIAKAFNLSSGISRRQVRFSGTDLRYGPNPVWTEGTLEMSVPSAPLWAAK